MGGELLSIALTVEQHESGSYYWVLVEFEGEDSVCERLLEAAAGFPTYLDALQAGYVVLKGLSGDLDVGPRDELVVLDAGDSA